jgi:hypothetical protein
MTMEMSKVKDCKVGDCAYNDDMCCHTMAITIGDGAEPKCDTFVSSPVSGGEKETTACVGACKMDDCKFNEHLECCSSEVHVEMKGTKPDCTTFMKC